MCHLAKAQVWKTKQDRIQQWIALLGPSGLAFGGTDQQDEPDRSRRASERLVGWWLAQYVVQNVLQEILFKCAIGWVIVSRRVCVCVVRHKSNCCAHIIITTIIIIIIIIIICSIRGYLGAGAIAPQREYFSFFKSTQPWMSAGSSNAPRRIARTWCTRIHTSAGSAA